MYERITTFFHPKSLIQIDLTYLRTQSYMKDNYRKSCTGSIDKQQATFKGSTGLPGNLGLEISFY